MRGYHKPIMIAGGVGNIRADHTHKHAAAGGHAAHPARRPGHADRHGRRRGVVDGHRREHRGPRLRFGAARQRRDRAPRAGSDRPLLAAGRRAIRSCRSTTSARAACRTRCRSSCTAAASAARSTCARSRRKSPACRRARSGATRRRSATCSRSRRASLPAFARDLRARALPVRGGRHRERATGGSSSRDAHFGNRPVDVPLDVILGKPPKMTRDVRARGAHAAAARPRAASTLARRRLSRAAVAGGRRQDVPRHDRRSHGRRPVLARSDGRPVAGAGRRRRGDADGLRRATRARRWRWASARRSR